MRPTCTSLLPVAPAAASGRRSSSIAARPPPAMPWEVEGPASRPAAVRELDATAWLLRMIVGLGAVLLAVDELAGAGPSAMHAALGLPAGARVGLAALELAAGAAVLFAASRAGVAVVVALCAALCVGLLAAGSALALQMAFVAACAVVLTRLDRLLSESTGLAGRA